MIKDMNMFLERVLLPSNRLIVSEQSSGRTFNPFRRYG
jgi:hypothetical protein